MFTLESPLLSRRTSGSAPSIRVSSASQTTTPDWQARTTKQKRNGPALALVAVMPTWMMRDGRMGSGGRLVYGMCSGSAIPRDGLRASHMHDWIPGDPSAESQDASAVMASFMSDGAERMALLMVARAAARSIGSSRRRYYDDAHVSSSALLFASSHVAENFPIAQLFVAILPLTVSTSFSTKSYNHSWRG